MPRPARIDRFIEKWPEQLSQEVSQLLTKFKDGSMTREEVHAKVTESLDTALNTVDGSMGRLPEAGPEEKEQP